LKRTPRIELAPVNVYYCAAEEQAALRRVATLVARGAPPAEVFDAVTIEMRHLLDADSAYRVSRSRHLGG
jgi:hypothetical protein